MANEQNSRRRSAKQTPQRVENAAQAMMNNAAYGGNRGYIPRVPPMNQGYGRQDPHGGQQPAPPYGGMPYGQTGRQDRSRFDSGLYQTKPQQTMNGTRGFVAISAGGQPPEPPRKKGKAGKIFAAVFIVLLLAGIGTGGYLGIRSYQHRKMIEDKVRPYDALFCPGVYVDGIPLGGMTPEQALNSVQSQIRQRNDAWKVQLTYQGKTEAEITAGMLSMSVDIGDVMNQAWLQGHQGDDERRYADMTALESNPYHGITAIPSGDNSVIDSLLAGIKNEIDTPAVDAALLQFDTTQPYPFVFSDEAYGRRLDTQPVIDLLYEMVSEMRSGTVELEPAVIRPNVTRLDLEKHYMLRSSVYTPIASSSTDNRNNNIRRAFEFINGYVLDPGSTFSFNNVVGQRTTNNGFFTAVEYAYGEHVEGVGGGVCQASTTLYQAAVSAGLQIVKREPHSDSVSYTEYGKDATVYWVGKRKIDFVFKNNTEEPIYIVAGVQTDPSNKRRLIAKVSMYGQDMGDVRYELESKVIQELDPPTDPVYVKDTEGTYVTYTDQEKSVSKAKPGYVVDSYRLKYEGNELTETKPLYTDTYEPKPERIYVGTKRRGE